MKSIHIDDKKSFTTKLFVKDDFDSFLLNEAIITTFNTYTIDGHIQQKFYSQEEYELLEKPEFTKWSDIKKLCFDIIKGNKTPLKFKIVFQLSKKDIIELLNDTETTISQEDILGMFINIKFENGSIDCVTGTSLRIFSMDKSLEEAFDKKIEKFLLALI